MAYNAVKILSYIVKMAIQESCAVEQESLFNLLVFNQQI